MTQTAKRSPFTMNVDLMHGPIFKSLVVFMLPIFVSNLFQQLYNTVDTMIVGNVLGDTALAVAKEHDCRLEVNTGGVYRGYRKDFYPGAWLLGEWQKMGGKVIITSDSHDINSLTYGFDEAAAAIKAAGFTSVQVLTGSGFETQEL